MKAKAETIETGVPYDKVRSYYARTLLAMDTGQSLKVYTSKRFNAYRIAAQRYDVAIVTKYNRRYKFWRIWKQGDTQRGQVANAIDPRARLKTRARAVVAKSGTKTDPRFHNR